MLAMMLAAFLVGIIVAIPPGSVTIEIGRRALTAGLRPALTFNLGSISADALYASAVYLGVSALVADSEAFRLGLWLIGGSWLIWLGWDACKARLDTVALAETAAVESFWQGYWRGVGVTLLNPLTVLAWISLAGNFFATAWQPGWGEVDEWGWLAILMMLAGAMAWTLFLIIILNRVRHWVSPRGLAVISVGAGLFLIFFGLRSWWLAAALLL